jgi:tyrosyl-tRNA synthetase
MIARPLAAFTRAGLTSSNGDARRQIGGGGLRVNDEAVSDEKTVLNSAHVRDGTIKLSLGKKKHVLIRPV